MSFSKLKQGKTVAFKDDLNITLIRPDDLTDIIQMLDDPRVNQYLFFAPADASLYEGFFGPIIENTQQAIAEGQWPDSPTFVIRDNKGEYMGMTAVTRVMFHQGNFELGYQLPYKAWGQGIASTACRILTEIAFTELGAHKVSADCYASNIGSYKTLEKSGFVREGCQEDYYKQGEGFDDKLYYGMTLRQFQMK